VNPLKIAQALAETSQRCYSRGWNMGTSGNFSIVLSHDPLRLAITASGRNKRTLGPADVVTVDERGELVPVARGGELGFSSLRPAGTSAGRPSAETLLHLTIARLRGAGSILHTHSVWSTMLSELHASAGGFAIEGFEMLKGLQGVTTHDHREWVPILENDQDMASLSMQLEEMLAAQPGAHAVLLRRHGLYTWGETLADAERHLEILEFLFETIGRLSTASPLVTSSSMAPSV
jgi:methylthioribulose-1-phosphate dehydratase